ncbi:MAG: hypothetical protein ACREAA_00460 [Candidatus Polarisedimenticolia bacterium]
MKKVAALAIVALVAVAASQPSVAGVGGCSPRAGVGGCWQLTASNPQPRTLTVVDSLRGAIPAEVLAMLRALLQEKSTSDRPPVIETPQSVTTAGVGGCFPRPGVGGCWL